jgi:hypothetical protein
LRSGSLLATFLAWGDSQRHDRNVIFLTEPLSSFGDLASGH